MKHRRHSIAFLVVGACSYFICQSVEASCPIHLAIELPKTEFTVGEPVIVRLSISNNSDSAIQFLEPLSGDFGRIGFWVTTKTNSSEQSWSARRGSTTTNRCVLRVINVPPRGQVTREIDLSWIPEFSRNQNVEVRIRLEQEPRAGSEFPENLLACESESDPVWISLRLPRHDYDLEIALDVLANQSPGFDFFRKWAYEFDSEVESEYRSWASLLRATSVAHSQNLAGCLFHLDLVEEKHLHKYLLEKYLATKAIVLFRMGEIDEADEAFSRLKLGSTQYANFGSLEELRVHAGYDCATSIFRPDWCNHR